MLFVLVSDFVLIYVCLYFGCCLFWFERETLVMIVQVPGCSLPFAFEIWCKAFSYTNKPAQTIVLLFFKLFL